MNETENVKILLVDDEPGNLLAMKSILERPDYDPVLANDGEEALVQVLRNDFAVILLDVSMPGMDGFEFASIIKQREASRTIPILFVTGAPEHKDWIFKAYDVGAVDFLLKPLDPRQVRAKVAVFVELYRQRQEIELQAKQLRERQHRAQAVELERQRFQHERRFRNLADSIPHIVWVAGADGAIQYVSRRWSEVTGRPESMAKGAGWFELVHPDDVADLRASWEESIRGGEPFQFEFRMRYASGALRWNVGRALPERENGSGVVRWLGTFTDADEHMRARDELRAAVNMREEFISVASHELRTPLTALMLRVHRMRRITQEKGDCQWMSGDLESAQAHVERLIALVDRLLDASRMVSGKMQLTFEELDLAELAREVAAGMADQASRSGSEIALHVEQSPVRGSWDRLRVGQLLTNLLSNAIKYGDGKPIDASISVDGDTARIRVTDRGIGMAPEAVERIFGRFERAAPVNQYSGLGLGLYVVAQVVAAHGGVVNVDSRVGKGSTFTVELPRRPALGEQGRDAG